MISDADSIFSLSFPVRQGKPCRIGAKLVEDIGVETLMWGPIIRTPMGCGRNRRNTLPSSSPDCPPKWSTR